MSDVQGCDDRLYEVVLLAPSTYLLRAPDEPTATRRALLLQPKDAACTGFPEVVSVKEVEQG